jgi:hypothetical protein
MVLSEQIHLSTGNVEILSFSNKTREEKKLLKKFVDFHWDHYRNDPHYVPLLDYEYLGFKLLGIVGFFEPKNLFFKHADMSFFLAKRDGRVVGRCNAFINLNHNRHWKDRVGFFGQFECIDDTGVARSLIAKAEGWLKAKGMEVIRGPQNLPVNDATPGLLTEGFDSRPVMYYHYNKDYYSRLLNESGFKPVKKVLSWEVEPQRPMEEKLIRVAEKVIKRYDVTVETWNERPLDERKREMLEIYNDAWTNNFGFVPFTFEEFSHIIDDMLLIMDKKLFIFLYVKGEPAAFFGGVPNVSEKLVPIKGCPRCELLRALRMLLMKSRIEGFRLGYLGVKRKFRRLGLDGVMLWKQKMYSREKYTYCDMGWVLEDNVMTIRLVEMMGSVPSKTYTVFEKAVG